LLSVILKACSFAFIIFMGYTLKTVGVFSKDSFRIVQKIVLNLTIPAAVITGFSACDVKPSMLIMAVLGVTFDCIMLAVGYFCGRGKSRELQAAWLNTIPGYNNGAFSLPFVRAFLPAESVLYSFVFDAGNAIICTGGAYAFASAVMDSGKLSLREIPRKLVKSVPFDFYVGMLIFSMCGLKLPGFVLTIVEPISQANTFLAMLMVGMMLEFRFEGGELKQMLSMVAVRYIGALVFAAFSLMVLPGMMGKAAALAVMGPISVAAMSYAEKCGAKPELVACENSITIILSVASLTAMVLLFGLS